MPKTLREVMPPEFMHGEYEYIKGHRYADAEVEHIFDLGSDKWLLWPGPHKYVVLWCVLKASGRAVGWNENPARVGHFLY